MMCEIDKAFISIPLNIKDLTSSIIERKVGVFDTGFFGRFS
jgi:hypothetical protein